MKLKYITLLLPLTLWASGAYDHGTAAGKGNLELDFTLNPFKYFDQGQSYVVFGYGLSNRLDLHGYYSVPQKGSDNYYLGVFYQFLDTKYLDLATALGVRKYVDNSTTHAFAPQLLYTVILGKGYRIGGSLVDIRSQNLEVRKGTALDMGLYIPVVKSTNSDRLFQQVGFVVGAFRPVLWKPKWGEWYPTYSVDVKLNFNGS
jgi:hypothetical protein